ncbi:lytic murein transglycosylase [Sphingomonas xanthus]|uniref:Lytic murein transglycosylase n=1 Tax=Sphingomonas xanthus TaxID=2594473 RepID=A0A516INX3_9SPHN|nr:lytic murein transglycosylase [Sphingomonas xanthus]QDP18612.1 lytic murein transglycosylase [Sphingomonas xanthus]
MRLGWAFILTGALATPASAQSDPLAPLPAQQPTGAPAQQAASAPAQQVLRAPVQQAASGFDGYRETLAYKARLAGVREATIQATIPYLRLNSTAIRLDRAQPGGASNPNAIPPFAPYKAKHVNSALIQRGRTRYRSHYARLLQIERRFGVEPQILMAIYGHETSYGSVTGNFDLVDVLATLAYEGRRREFFEEEFVAALKLLDRGTSRSRLKGSWAGATGYPQFMPTNVLRLAVDGDGDGYANIWSNELDGLASIANYLRDAGWKPDLHWGIPVRVPSTLNRAAIVSRLKAPRCEAVYRRHSQWKTVREWRALGVMPTRRSLPDHEMATLIEPDGPNATAYLLTTNYRAILDYNCSNFYALSVGLLGDAIAGD